MFKVDIEITSLLKMIEEFDGELAWSIKHEAGYRAVKLIKTRYLSGQALKYNGFVDIKGRKKIQYKVFGKGAVITSYPLNIWERAHRSRSGERMIPGKRVFRSARKFIKSGEVIRAVQRECIDKFAREH